MEEALGVIFGILVLAVAGTFLIGAILGIVAFARGRRWRRVVAELRRDLDRLLERVNRVEGLLEKAAIPPVEPVVPTPPPEDAAPPPAPEVPAEVAPAPPPAELPPRPVAVRPPRDWARLEQVIGRRWMTWVGVVVLFFAVAFFVRHAIKHGWIGPTAQVMAGIVLGIVLLVCGDRCVRRKMRPLGQGLIGGGLAVLYVSLFASFSLYELVPQAVAFVAIVFVTAAGMTLAVLHGAMAISFLAVLGGLLTPVLLSTGVDARDVLFSYLVLLNLGVLGVALFKQWRALDVLAFVGTAALFAGWFVKFYAPPAMVPALLWLGAFYLIFLLLPFANHLRRRTVITLERFVMALANATLVFACAYRILRADHPYYLGFVVLGMAACYLTVGAQTRRRIPADARGLFGFIALAGVFLTLAVPLHLRLHGITLAWAVEGPVLLYLGYRFRYRLVRTGGFILLVLVLIRLFAVDWPAHGALFVPIWNRHFGAAMCLPLAAAAFAVIHQWWKRDASAVDRALKLLSAIGGGFLALMVLHSELGQWFYYSDRSYLGTCALPVLWALGSAGFVGAGLRMRSVHSRYVGLVALAVALILGARAYGHSVPDDYLLFLNTRFVASLVAVLMVFLYSFLLRRFREICPGREQTVMRCVWWAGVFLLLALLSAEAYSYCRETVLETRKAGWMALMSLSLVWAVYAAAVLAIGFWRRVQALRLAALGLFFAAVLKVVLVDMIGVKELYRVISFLVLALLIIGASYLYYQLAKRLEPEAGEEQ